MLLYLFCFCYKYEKIGRKTVLKTMEVHKSLQVYKLNKLVQTLSQYYYCFTLGGFNNGDEEGDDDEDVHDDYDDDELDEEELIKQMLAKEQQKLSEANSDEDNNDKEDKNVFEAITHGHKIVSSGPRTRGIFVISAFTRRVPVS